MAHKPQWIVFLGDRTLAVARAANGQVKTSETVGYEAEAAVETAEAIEHLLHALDYGAKPVMLALASSWCTSATVFVPSSRQARKRGAIGFLVEPHLPWSVEDAVIDYELLGTKRVFAVSSEAQPLAQLIGALEERGITVASVAPAARLALEHHLRQAKAIGPRYALLWRHDETVDLWLVEQNRPVLWNWLPYEVGSVARALRHVAVSADLRLPVVGRHFPAQFLKESAAEAGLEVLDVPALDSEDPLVAATQEGSVVLHGRRPAAIELRRDQLAMKDRNRPIRSHLRVLQGASLLFLAALGIALFHQARQTEALRDTYDQRQTVLFRRFFPGERVPVAIHARLQSELGRLKGVRGERSDLPETVSFVTILEPLLKALPVDLRFRLLEVRVENGQLYLVGQVRAHGDADRIAETLRLAGLEVASPNTNRLEKEGVEFRISARLIRTDNKKPLRKTT